MSNDGKISYCIRRANKILLSLARVKISEKDVIKIRVCLRDLGDRVNGREPE